MTQLGGGGDLLSNANRWRQQVGLQPIDQQELDGSVESLTVSDKPASMIEAIGDKQAILAAVIPDATGKWFIKMQGPKEAVQAERERFRQFLDSVTFAEC